MPLEIELPARGCVLLISNFRENVCQQHASVMLAKPFFATLSEAVPSAIKSLQSAIRVLHGQSR
jgi:hypothetical protein